MTLTDSFGVYGGGGVGAGGYTYGADVNGNRGFDDPAAAFAWQAGGGVIWEVTERTALHCDRCCLSDAEIDLSPEAWAELEDPFPAWRIVADEEGVATINDVDRGESGLPTARPLPSGSPRRFGTGKCRIDAGIPRGARWRETFDDSN